MHHQLFILYIKACLNTITHNDCNHNVNLILYNIMVMALTYFTWPALALGPQPPPSAS
jgi:hypothetical protein